MKDIIVGSDEVITLIKVCHVLNLKNVLQYEYIVLYYLTNVPTIIVI